VGRHDRRFATKATLVLLGAASLPAVLLLGPFHLDVADKQLTVILTYVGVLVTASVSLIGMSLSRQTERRLQLEAAMRAGELFSPTGSTPAVPAAMASGLLALTKLGHAELAVALLVDLGTEDNDKVSNETAILVIDAALRSESRNAKLVAAELLCRNAERLNPSQSLD
jgi:hypothetical protein